MRTIEKLQINELNDCLTITADDKNEANGNASHHYTVTLHVPGGPESVVAQVDFQDGPIGEVGFNGGTNEALLEIVLDRIASFQSSKFSCRENALAFTHIELGLMYLMQRTRKRVAQGVEGTHETHK